MNVQTIANEIKATGELWDKHVVANKSIQEDLAPYGYPGLLKSEFGSYFFGLSDALEKLAPLANSGVDPFLKRSLDGLQNVINNLGSNRSRLMDNPGGVIAAVIQGIELLRAPFVANGFLSYFKDYSKKQSSDTTLAVSQVSASVIQARKHLAEASNLRAELDGIKSSVEKIKNDIEPLRISIDNQVKETNTKTQQVEENRAKVQAFTTDYIILKKNHDELLTSIESYKSTISALALEHKSQIEKVRTTLVAAERVGLANSFSARKDELKIQGLIWLCLLVASLIGLFFVGLWIIHPALVGTVGVERVIALFSEIPLTAPFIWVGWYAATQLGYNLRVSEDYSFKVASALALDGYKKEVSAVDKELEKRLLEGAIGNFSENPIRIFQKKDVNGSPWQELLKHPEVREKFKSLTDALINVGKK